MGKKSLLIFIVLLLALCGCAGSKAASAAAPEVTLAPEPTAEPASATPAPTEPPVPEWTPGPFIEVLPEPTFEPAPEPEERFTVAWLPDMQRIVYQQMSRYQLTDIMDWAREHAAERNLLCVLQTGDFSDNMFKDWQAEFCDESVARLGDVPFLAVAGNHDIGYYAHSYTAWLERPFITGLPEENRYAGGKCVSGLYKSGSTELIVVGMGYGMRTDKDAIAWVREQFQAHPGAVGILFCHEFLNAKGQYLLGYPVMEEVVALCPNVRFILCGHCHGTARNTFSFDDDGDGTQERTVNAMVFDYQEEWNDKLGYMVLLTFDPETRSVSVVTYSPSLDDYVCHDDAADKESFVLGNAF